MSIDASRFGDLTSYIHVIWSGEWKILSVPLKISLPPLGPFQIILALVLLYRQMQLAIIPGVFLLLLLIPINIVIQKIQKKLTVCRTFE